MTDRVPILAIECHFEQPRLLLLAIDFDLQVLASYGQADTRHVQQRCIRIDLNLTYFECSARQGANRVQIHEHELLLIRAERVPAARHDRSRCKGQSSEEYSERNRRQLPQTPMAHIVLLGSRRSDIVVS